MLSHRSIALFTWLILAEILIGINVVAAPTSSGEGRRKQIERELTELEVNQARQSVTLQSRLDEAQQAQQTLDTAHEHYQKALQEAGRYSPEAAAAWQEVAQARQALYARISAREHARYQLEILNKGIQDRRTYLQFRQISIR